MHIHVRGSQLLTGSKLGTALLVPTGQDLETKSDGRALLMAAKVVLAIPFMAIAAGSVWMIAALLQL